MSSSVSIDIDALESALSGLASRIESQRSRVVSGTPCSVPSLSDGTVAAVASWLTEQEPELSTRLDRTDIAGTDQADSYAGRAAQELRPWISVEELQDTYSRAFQTFHTNPVEGDQ